MTIVQTTTMTIVQTTTAHMKVIYMILLNYTIQLSTISFTKVTIICSLLFVHFSYRLSTARVSAVHIVHLSATSLITA